MFNGRAARLAILLVPLVLSGCSLFVPRLDPPEVVLRSVYLEKLTLTEQVFRVQLHLTNPNNANLRIAGAQFRLQLEDIDTEREPMVGA